jgi:Uma2 family endonuclease
MLNTTLQIEGISEDELLRLDAIDERYEVINGELVPMSPVGFLHVIIAGNVYRILYDFAMRHGLGYVMGDSLIYVFERSADGKIINSRIPDASFIQKANFPTDFEIQRPIPRAPDLAVEVVSPSESAEDLQEKIRDYLSRETLEVWVLYPELRELYQYRRSDPHSVRIYQGDEVIEAEGLFPGSQFAVQDFFFVPQFKRD